MWRDNADLSTAQTIDNLVKQCWGRPHRFAWQSDKTLMTNFISHANLTKMICGMDYFYSLVICGMHGILMTTADRSLMLPMLQKKLSGCEKICIFNVCSCKCSSFKGTFQFCNITKVSRTALPTMQTSWFCCRQTMSVDALFTIVPLSPLCLVWKTMRAWVSFSSRIPGTLLGAAAAGCSKPCG